MNLFKAFILSCASLFASFGYAHNDVKYYGPEHEKLMGTAIYLTFPGRPNYTSIKEGDEAERHAYILLDKPIDVKTKHTGETGKDADYADKHNIRLVQLIVTHREDFKLIKNGQTITVKGEISGAISGHHHAKILITANELSVSSNQNPKPATTIKKMISNSPLDFNDYTECAPFTYELKELTQDGFSNDNDQA